MRKKNQNNIIKIRTQIKKISGEESHSSEGKKTTEFREKCQNTEMAILRKKLSYRIKVKILTLKQNLSVTAQKSKKKKKLEFQDLCQNSQKGEFWKKPEF